MRFSYTFTVWDYGEALRLHRGQKISRRVSHLLLYRVIPVLAAAGLMFLNAFSVKAQLQITGLLLSFAIALLWIGIMLALVPYEAVRIGFKRCAPSVQITASVDDECVLIQTPGISEIKTFWNGFVSFAQNDKISLLYFSEDRFLLFPTGAMPSEQRQELVATIERNLVRK
jgi:hypothetical protein